MSGRETSPAGRPSTFSPRKKEFKLGDKPYKGICHKIVILEKTFHMRCIDLVPENN